MKRTFIFLLVVICAGSFSLKSAQSAVPQLINYQGLLTDAAGDPVVDDSYQVKFIIWDASAAGNDKWNSGFQTINTVDGLFEYILGSNVALPDNIFEDTIRYLGITVDTDSEISPRTRLVSAGYAYHALRADTAGIAVSVFPNSIGSSEVIDNSLTSSDLAANSVEASEIATSAVGSGEILNNSILDLDIFDEPGIDWNNTSGVGNSHDLSSSWITINQISISHPASGYVVIMATGHVDYDVSTYHGNIEMGWATSSTGTPTYYNRVSLDGVIGGTTYIPITAIFTYVVNGNFNENILSAGSGIELDNRI